MERQKPIKGIAAVDLFCGAGGLTHGLIKGGIAVRAGFDIDSKCQHAYEHNNKIPYIIKDVAQLTKQDISAFFKEEDEVRVLAGCAPCQPFSRYTQGQKSEQDQRWGMLYQFSRLIDDVSPDIVTMENVPQVIRHTVYKDFVLHLEKSGYDVDWDIVRCADYGIPQKRQRLVLLASKTGKIRLIPKTHGPDNHKTVRDTIQNLKPLSPGKKNSQDSLHISSRLSALNLERIKASKPGGTWLDWDEDLIAECHRKEGRQTYKSVYGRMSWDLPAPTITTQFTGFGNGRFGHPDQNRAISLREGALFQTFPKDYEFVDPKESVTIKHIARMIGNAVPVELGRVIGVSIKKHVSEHHGQNFVK